MALLKYLRNYFNALLPNPLTKRLIASGGNALPQTCLHPNQTRVTINSTATCETIADICDDCSAVLKTETEC